MANIVGPKGQVVISKEIRDKAGVKPGWRTLQRLVGDHVEMHFVPPEHEKSLKGSLKPHIKATVAPGEAWGKARDEAWRLAARGRVSGRKRGR